MLIRLMQPSDRDAVIEMMRVFYRSDAVNTNGSEEIFRRDFEACVGDCVYAEGYVFEEASTILGYGMLAKSYSTEYGRPCIWIEDIYLQEPYRSKGNGTAFLQYVRNRYPEHLIRLEAEEENHHAVHVYEKNGFREMPYLELFTE